jgi:copper resistance protein C
MSRASTSRIIASLAFAMAATTAFAHAQLQKAAPPVGGVVTATPTEIRLKFSEGVEPRFSGITLAAEAGAAQSTGKPALDPADPSVLIVTIGQPLKPGVYTVTWHAVSVDTHKTQGKFNFTFAP